MICILVYRGSAFAVLYFFLLKSTMPESSQITKLEIAGGIRLNFFFNNVLFVVVVSGNFQERSPCHSACRSCQWVQTKIYQISFHFKSWPDQLSDPPAVLEKDLPICHCRRWFCLMWLLSSLLTGMATWWKRGSPQRSWYPDWKNLVRNKVILPNGLYMLD